MGNRQTNQSSIVILADGVRAQSLGPYGNTCFQSAAVNQFAAESVVFEKCISDSPELQPGVQSILTGQHSCDSRTVSEKLPLAIAGVGVDCCIFTTNVERFDAIEGISENMIVVPVEHHEKLQTETSATVMGQFLIGVLAALEEIENPTCILIDWPGVSGDWDAPYPYREKLVDEDDPKPHRSTTAPAFSVDPGDLDPDQLFTHHTAYGAQITLFDELFGVFLTAIDSHPVMKDALLCLTSTRGFPLGEHGVVGYHRPVLGSEILKVPLMIRWPNRSGAGRSHQLVQPGSLFQLLCDWHGSKICRQLPFPEIDLSNFPQIERNAAVISVASSADSGSRPIAIETHAWKFVTALGRSLYVRPDDVWDFNDVVDLCPDVADELERELAEAVGELESGRYPEFALSASLTDGIE